MMPPHDLREDVLDEVRQLLREFRADETLLHAQARLVADLGLDSLELASAVISLEDRFAVDLVGVVDEDMTVADLLDAISSRRAPADVDG
jgi:acyl carrier protein